MKPKIRRRGDQQSKEKKQGGSGAKCSAPEFPYHSGVTVESGKIEKSDDNRDG
jgi:hypothetical protein